MTSNHRRVLKSVGVAAALFVSTAQAVFAQVSDTTPPHLVTVSFAPISLDVTGGPGTVTVDATVTDDLAGVSLVYAQFRSPSGKQLQPYNWQVLPRVAGTGLNGAYRGAIQIPRFSEAGVWKLSLYLYDATNNYVSLSAINLQALGLPTDLTVISIPIFNHRSSRTSACQPASSPGLASRRIWMS